MKFLKRGIFLFLILFIPLAWSQNSVEATEIKIGVLAKQGVDTALQKWQPTASYLNQRLGGYHFTIVAMEFDEIPLLVDKKLVDFVIVNSGIYVDLSVRFSLRRILTLKNRYNSGQKATEFGSVIFTRKAHTDIWTLSDLKDKEIAAVHPTSFGGWIMALRELIEQGLSVDEFANVHFENTHNAVVEAVLANVADAGIVRTDTLERMAQTGKLNLDQLRILNEQQVAGFPFKLSTRLYPEWPMAKLEHTSSMLARSIAIAMMQMPEQSTAAIAADIEGWTIPENYLPVHDILQQLKLPPYQHYGDVTLRGIFMTYGYWVIAIIAVVLFQSILMASIFTLNKKLSKQQAELRQSEERFKATFEQAAVGILHVSINGELLRVNQKFCQSLGYSETEILKFNFQDLNDSLEISDEYLLLDRMRKHEIDSFSYQKDYHCKDGSKICGLTTVSCIRGADENIKYLVVVVDDVSDVIALEQKIARQQYPLILDKAEDVILGQKIDDEKTSSVRHYNDMAGSSIK